MTLLELLHLLRKKWYLVVVFPLVFAGATAIYCWGFMSNDYTSDVSLYVLNKTDEQSSNITSSDTTASQQLANDIAVMAQSNRVIDATAQSLGMSTLKGYDIKVTSATTNRVITLSVTGKKPEAVAQIANELAKQTADTAVEVMELKAVNIVDAAQVPNAPSGPNRIMYTAVAFLAGLFFAAISRSFLASTFSSASWLLANASLRSASFASVCAISSVRAAFSFVRRSIS